MDLSSFASELEIVKKFLEEMKESDDRRNMSWGHSEMEMKMLLDENSLDLKHLMEKRKGLDVLLVAEERAEKLMATYHKANALERELEKLSKAVEDLKEQQSKKASSSATGNQRHVLKSDALTRFEEESKLLELERLQEKREFEGGSEFEVRMTKPFYISEGEVVQMDQYDTVCLSNEAMAAAEGVYTTPCKGVYRFLARPEVGGQVDWCLRCDGDGRRENLTDFIYDAEKGGYWMALDMECDKNVKVCLEVVGISKYADVASVWFKGGMLA